jgi:hypothetical protein
MKRAQIIIQNFELLDCGGNFGEPFASPQNIVEITAPENFNVTRVTFQSYIERDYNTNALKPFCTLNSSPPALPGDGYVFFPQIIFDNVTSLFNVYNPQQTISFENYLDAPLQGNFYAAFCTDSGQRNGRLTVVWEGYYYE